MNAYILLGGQGSQFAGVGKKIYEESAEAKRLFETANDILGFRITDTMFYGNAAELKNTRIAQPALFLYTTILSLTRKNEYRPSMVAGYSLGEYSALVFNKILSFEDGLNLIHRRSGMMHEYCRSISSGLGMVFESDNDAIEKICREIAEETGERVEIAIYGFPIVIGGTLKGIDIAAERILNSASNRKVIKLDVEGAFHTSMMEPLRNELSTIIDTFTFHPPEYPFYQNHDGLPHKDTEEIKKNLVEFLTTPVRWGNLIKTMINDGATNFIEFGPGTVLQGIVKNKININ